MKIQVCGAFNANVTVREGETVEQAAERVERTIQGALDKYVKRLDVSIGVDFGDLDEE